MRYTRHCWSTYANEHVEEVGQVVGREELTMLLYEDPAQRTQAGGSALLEPASRTRRLALHTQA